jgi:nucleoside 2-deoxyribosyltransferase
MLIGGLIMKIYVIHSTSFDFAKELYEPLKNSEIYNRHTWYLPYEMQEKDSKELIKNCDLIIAEISYPSTGSGIELGWANSFNKPIICFYKKGEKYSTSIRYISNQIAEYESSNNMIQKLENIISGLKK